jgi:hypothetical protein
MENDPNDADYCNSVRLDLMDELLSGDIPWEAFMLPVPKEFALDTLFVRDKDVFDLYPPALQARLNVLIDAEIERRRIGMIQRENHGRMRRGEPLIEP